MGEEGDVLIMRDYLVLFLCLLFLRGGGDRWGKGGWIWVPPCRMGEDGGCLLNFRQENSERWLEVHALPPEDSAPATLSQKNAFDEHASPSPPPPPCPLSDHTLIPSLFDHSYPFPLPPAPSPPSFAPTHVHTHTHSHAPFYRLRNTCRFTYLPDYLVASDVNVC